MFADENNVCLCFNVSKETIVKAIKEKGLKTLSYQSVKIRRE